MRIRDINSEIRKINRLRLRLLLSLLIKAPSNDARFCDLLGEIRDRHLRDDDCLSRIIAEEAERDLRIYGKAGETQCTGPFFIRKHYVRHRRKRLSMIRCYLRLQKRKIRSDRFWEGFWDMVMKAINILLFPISFLVLIVAIPVITVEAVSKKYLAILFWAAVYASMIVPAVMGNWLYVIPLLVYFIVHLIITIRFYKELLCDNTTTSLGQNADPGHKEDISGLFDGLVPEEAKRKYRALMKKYHPDNTDGDCVMAGMVANAYDEYKHIHADYRF